MKFGTEILKTIKMWMNMIKTMKIGPSIMKTNVKRLKIGALKA